MIYLANSAEWLGFDGHSPHAPQGISLMKTFFRMTLAAIAAPAVYQIGIGSMKIAIAVIYPLDRGITFAAYEGDSITPFEATAP